MVLSPRCKRLCIYMRVYAYARSIMINLPDAYENNAGLRGPLDLNLLMRRVRRRCFRRLLESHFGGWRGGWLTSKELHCTELYCKGEMRKRALLHSRLPRSRSEAVISVAIKFGLRRAPQTWTTAFFLLTRHVSPVAY